MCCFRVQSSNSAGPDVQYLCVVLLLTVGNSILRSMGYGYNSYIRKETRKENTDEICFISQGMMISFLASLNLLERLALILCDDFLMDLCHNQTHS